MHSARASDFKGSENIVKSCLEEHDGPAITEDVEPNVQRHVKTQPENPRLVYILL